jgi:hypothetical protein
VFDNRNIPGKETPDAITPFVEDIKTKRPHV